MKGMSLVLHLLFFQDKSESGCDEHDLQARTNDTIHTRLNRLGGSSCSSSLLIIIWYDSRRL